MLKDIPQLVVENLALAAVQEQIPEGGTEWNVYLINLYDQRIEGVSPRTRGIGPGNLEFADVRLVDLLQGRVLRGIRAAQVLAPGGEGAVGGR